MRLAMTLFRKKMPNGHIFRGKDRLVKIVTNTALNTLRKDYEMEEQNMLLLRHPYLTMEQSYGHAQALRKKEDQRIRWQDAKVAKFPKHVTLEDRLMHLRVREVWD